MMYFIFITIPFYAFVGLLVLTSGCAQLPEEYSTEPNPEYAITYLLTEFEGKNHKNAEGLDRDANPSGYHYIFGDKNSEVDYIEPYPEESGFCRTSTLTEFYESFDTDTAKLLKAIQNGDTDANLKPYPEKCTLSTGLRNHSTNPFPHFDSRQSFRIRGTTAGSGVGFGTYFSDYQFLPIPDSATGGKTRVRDENGNLAATFSDGRLSADEKPLCSDDASFAGVIEDAYYADDRKTYVNRDKHDRSGIYEVSGSVYTAGKIWVDTDGEENYELDHPYPAKLKEPRCMKDMGQKGFVMWAMGNAPVEVLLNVVETAPLSDGGLCDEDAGEKCYDFHRVRFELDGEWREYHAAFEDFVQDGWGPEAVLDPNRIINVQIKVMPPVNGDPRPFEIWLDHIGFYGGKAWEFVERMSDTDNMVYDTEVE
jgi:hypothetical protein